MNSKETENQMMKKVIIIYNSKTGTTKKYSNEIGMYLRNNGNEVVVLSIEEYTNDKLNHADYLLLGCWTSGLMFFLQHPEKIWIDFATKLPNPLKPKIALFTTYKILTGSMFKKMHMHLNGLIGASFTAIKSRNGVLSESDKKVLDKFINLQ